MSAYSNAIRNYVERYRREHGAGDGLIDPHLVAEWAYQRGLHKPNVKTVIDAIASDISQMFREDYRTDPRGRRYRAMHARLARSGAGTRWLWADMDDLSTPHSHFQRSFAERRQRIVADCLQLKTDVDVYNDKRQPADPVQLLLDFTLDVIELQQPLDRAA